MNRIALYFLAITLTAPFVADVRHAAPLPSFYSEWLAALLGLGGLFVFLSRKGDGLFIPSALLAPVALAIVFSLHGGLITPPYPTLLTLTVEYLVLAALLMLAAHNLGKFMSTESLHRPLAMALLLGGGVSALLGIAQHWGLDTLAPAFIAKRVIPESYGNLAQANHYATYQVMALVALTYLHAAGRWSRLALVVVAPILLLSLSYSGARSTWLYLATLLLLAWFVRSRLEDATRRNLVFAATYAFVVFGMIQFALSLAPNESLTALERLGADLPVVAQDAVVAPHARQMLYGAAWGLFLEHPLGGVGLQQLPLHYLQFHASQGMSVLTPLDSIRYVHNLPLQFMAELGFAGLLLALAMMVWLVRAVITIKTIEAWMAMVILTIISLHALLEYPLHYAYFLVPFSILAGRHSGTLWHFTLRPRLLQVLALSVLVAGLFLLVNMLVSYQALSKLHAKVAASHTLGDAEDRRLVAQAMMAGGFLPEVENMLNSLAIDPARPEQWPRQLEISHRQVRYSANEPRLTRHILLLALNGHLGEMHHFHAMAHAIYPDYHSGLLRRAQSLHERLPGHAGLASLVALLNSR